MGVMTAGGAVVHIKRILGVLVCSFRLTEASPTNIPVWVAPNLALPSEGIVSIIPRRAADLVARDGDWLLKYGSSTSWEGKGGDGRKRGDEQSVGVWCTCAVRCVSCIARQTTTPSRGCGRGRKPLDVPCQRVCTEKTEGGGGGVK